MRLFGLFALLFCCMTLTSCMLEEDGVAEGVYQGTTSWTGVWTPGDTVDNIGYQPQQPIPFSHKLHAGDKQIPCQYCHFGARRSHAAVIPGLNTCMGCHRFVRPDSELIQYITKLYENNEPIEWVKVHDIPDHAHFIHSQHIKAEIACEKCHGQVQQMEEVKQVAPLQMGWCIDCHRENNAQFNCSACHY